MPLQVTVSATFIKIQQKINRVYAPYKVKYFCFLAVKGKLFQSQWLDLVGIQNFQRFYACPCYVQVGI